MSATPNQNIGSSGSEDAAEEKRDDNSLFGSDGSDYDEKEDESSDVDVELVDVVDDDDSDLDPESTSAAGEKFHHRTNQYIRVFPLPPDFPEWGGFKIPKCSSKLKPADGTCVKLEIMFDEDLSDLNPPLQNWEINGLRKHFNNCWPNLRRLLIRHLRVIDVGSLAEVIKAAATSSNPTKIKDLSIEIGTINPRDPSSPGYHRQWMKLASVIRTHLQGLEKFCLGLGYFPREDKEFLDPTIQALAGLPHLQDVDIYEINSYRSGAENLEPSAHVLGHLYSCSTIRKLRLDAMNLADEHILLLPRNLRNMENLRFNSISRELQDAQACVQALVTTITQNPTLQTLSLSRQNYYYSNLDGFRDVTSPILEAVKDHPSISELWLTNILPNPKEEQATSKESILSLLETNCNLKEVHLREGCLPECACTYMKDDIKFYTTLNKAGRGSLILHPEATSADDWVNALIEVRDHVDCLYYFLSHKPSLCEVSCSNEQGNHEISSTRSKQGTKKPPKKRQRR